MRLTEAREFTRAGRFVDALRVLDGGAAPTADKVASEILRIGLLERLGYYAKSRFLAERALKSRGLAASHQSDCQFVLGLIDWDEGHFDTGLEHFQRARDLARAAGDAHRACWVQLRLMVVHSSRISPQGAAPLIAQARVEVMRLGDPSTSAALHIFVGEIAVKHGALQTGRRHTLLGLRLLDGAPNAWLSALAQNSLVALALIESNFEAGLRHALTASEAAELSGAITLRRACLGNLGNLYALSGALDKARELFQRAATQLQTEGEYNHGVLESIARLELLEDRVDAARACLDTIDSAVRSQSDTALYAHRHSQLTRSLLLLSEGRWSQALEQTALTLDLAHRSGDRLLVSLCKLTEAEILGQRCQEREFSGLLDAIGPLLPTLPVELLGHYERIIAGALASLGETRSGGYAERAARMFKGLGHRPGEIQLRRTLQAAAAEGPKRAALAHSDQPMALNRAGIVQDISALLLHAGRPELVARDLVQILASAECIAHASAIARQDDGTVDELASYSAPSLESQAAMPERRYLLGQARERAVEVVCTPRADIESMATVNAVASLLAVVRDLESARVEREERLGLWPIEELPDEGDEAVITGSMREVMRLARKVAPTGASVLITGESGTGKEIVARAIHRFSNRPGRPFVPFNCTAVPRDLLESQLFGHRRGAFTGAERDHPGLIRAAKEGTLFLDEVGELGLELQPKLLRFLESGEITPLGESDIVTVNVRVVAATNADLDRLVHEGRFRADLYYRLRVIPLHIAPLRERRDEIPHLVHHFVTKAANEYGKGCLRIDDETMELLVLYAWPGNIRQLNNELRRIVALADADATLTPDALSTEVSGERLHATRASGNGSIPVTLDGSLNANLARVERQIISAALKKHHGRVDATAKALGISRKGLYLKRQRFGL